MRGAAGRCFREAEERGPAPVSATHPGVARGVARVRRAPRTSGGHDVRVAEAHHIMPAAVSPAESIASPAAPRSSTTKERCASGPRICVTNATLAPDVDLHDSNKDAGRTPPCAAPSYERRRTNWRRRPGAGNLRVLEGRACLLAHLRGGVVKISRGRRRRRAQTTSPRGGSPRRTTSRRRHAWTHKQQTPGPPSMPSRGSIVNECDPHVYCSPSVAWHPVARSSGCGSTRRRT